MNERDTGTGLATLRDPGLAGMLRGIARILAGKPRLPRRLRDRPLLTTILSRRSRRSFRDTPVPDEVMEAVLEAGRLAPSTVNLQTWSFAAFDRETWRETLGQPLPLGGQRAIVVMADTHRVRSVLDVFPDAPLVEYTLGVVNASLAAMNMTLAAEALGLGTVMLSETGRGGFLDTDHLAARLGLPERVVPLLTIVLGYPRGPRPAMPPKLPPETVTFAGRYREADPGVMRSWLEQMQAGYKVSNRGRSFGSQVAVYLGKIDRAERELRRRVLGEDGGPPAAREQDDAGGRADRDPRDTTHR